MPLVPLPEGQKIEVPGPDRKLRVQDFGSDHDPNNMLAAELDPKYKSLGPWILGSALNFYIGQRVRMIVQISDNPGVVQTIDGCQVPCEGIPPEIAQPGVILMHVFLVENGKLIIEEQYAHMLTKIGMTTYPSGSFCADSNVLKEIISGHNAEPEMYNQFSHLPIDLCNDCGPLPPPDSKMNQQR